MKNNNVFYLQLAYKRAQIAFLNNNVPVGCVITDKNSFLISKYNINSKNNDNINHAEMRSIFEYNQMNKKNNSTNIYVSLIPCPMCSGAIYVNNIKNCYYGTNSNISFYNDIFYRIMKNSNTSTFLKKRCSQILKLFFLVRR